MKKFRVRMSLIGLLSLFVLNIVSAQTFNLQSLPTERSQFGLRFLHPSIKSDMDVSTFSGLYEFSINIPINDKLNFVSIIPYISAKFEIDSDYYSYEFDESGAGNIFIGLQTNKEIGDDKRSVVSFGLFLPTADEDVSLFGIYSDYCSFPKYFPDALSLYFNYAYHNIKQNGLRFGMELGPTILIPTKDTGMDTEIYLHYGISTGFKAKQFLLNLELLGLAILTEDIDKLEDRFVHSINFGSAWIMGNVVPKVYYKLYLKEDISDIVDSVFGVGISISTN